MNTSQPTALVTGGSGGLGRDLCHRLAQAGYAVAVHYRSRACAGQEIAESITASGGTARAFGADLALNDEAQRLVNEVTAWTGRLDVLVNNAGVYVWKDNSKLTEEEWFSGLNSTATATFFTTRAALPWLRQSNCGRVINIGDSGCERPTARSRAMGYHIGKTGVLMITRSIAAAEAAHGISCNMISPGYLKNSEDAHTAPEIPAGRLGTFTDIWAAVAFLLSPESSYLTGSHLTVGGGWNLR